MKPNIIHEWVCDKCKFSQSVIQGDKTTVTMPSIPFESIVLGNGRAERMWCPECVLETFGEKYVQQSDVEMQRKIMEGK